MMKTSLCFVQNKYKESGKKSQSVSVYSQLPETNHMQFAKAVCQIQSEVRSGTPPNPVRYCGQTTKTQSDCVLFFQNKYKEASKRDASSCLYSKLPETQETLRAKEASHLQSQVCTGAV